VCGLKPFLRAWKPLRGWGVWVEGHVGGVRAEALSEGVEAPAGLGCAWAEAEAQVEAGLKCGLKPFLRG